MVYLRYKNFDDLYLNLSRIPLLEKEKYDKDLILSGHTYYMNNILIEVENCDCSIDMSKLNYTILKWKILINKYIDQQDYLEFKEKIKENKTRTCTFNFKIHNNGKDACMIALVLGRDNPEKPWTDIHVYYRITEIYKKFAIDLILLNKIINELPNCEISNIILHIPKFFFSIAFLAELIGEGYFTLEEFNKENRATEILKEKYNKHYLPGAKLSKYKSIARKQKLKSRKEKLPNIPIENLIIFEETNEEKI